MKKKILGIVGGMGPMATVECFRMIVENTMSSNDQDHIRILIDNNTCVPDRTKAILDNGDSPVPYLVDSANKLKSIGADFVIIPCNTSHYFIDEIKDKCSIYILNMIEETAKFIREKKIKKVGLLATTGTVKGKIYEKVFDSYGISIILPSEEEQRIIMEFIYDGVKAGNLKYDTSLYMNIVNTMFDNGAETMVLGCTEIPVGMKMYNLSYPCVDAMKALALASIQYAGYEVK